MGLDRRSVVAGLAVGGAGALWAGTTGPLLDTYSTSVGVYNDRSTTVSARFLLNNDDDDETVVDRSLSLPPDGQFTRGGVLSKNTSYTASIRTDDRYRERSFGTYGRGYEFAFYITADGIDAVAAHTD